MSNGGEKTPTPPPPPPQEDDIALFEAKVRRMREMGVTEWGDIKLGPAPQSAPKQLTGKEQLELARKREEQQRDILFAASHLKPSMKLVGK